MSSTAGSGPLLDADSPETVRLTPEEASAIGIKALGRIGYEPADAKIIVDQLVDNSLCGYRFAGLPRIMAIAGDEKARHGRKPITTVRETPVSALLDGGNEIGYIVAYRAAEVAIAKARTSGIACVGAYNSYYSGRNAYFVEKVAREGLVAIHIASAKPRVLPVGGARPALGTNPLCFGFPSKEGPVIFDMGTAALMWGDVLLHAHLGQPLPEGIGFDADGRATTDARETLKGGVVPFGGHKGYGLSFAVQAMGLLAGATFARGEVQDYGFLFWVVDPAIMFTEPDFETQMSELVRKIKATPKQPGVDEIRIPSERARRERERRRVEGIVVERKVIEALEAL
ncbi:MAG: Ldh family oxidoreductase [Rhodocyclaceae bacterium]|jgi:LDH2 family malate/lactate/ureidoglycolate dehydrogenase|nr:Ldh family oxidoreductase [Rhodocyclaceae bacterium]MCA3111336.1 Ldh family oxidoreductase [Rhodocyclaceae bacterium]MCA3115213.1 Ldh family oxidoreductase [Rhodocyclaceae bacterium]